MAHHVPNVVFQFDSNTNRKPVSTPADVQALLTLEPAGLADGAILFTGGWVNKTTLELTVVFVDAGIDTYERWCCDDALRRVQFT